MSIFPDEFIGSEVFNGAVIANHEIDFIPPVVFTGIKIRLFFRNFIGDVQIFSVSGEIQPSVFCISEGVAFSTFQAEATIDLNQVDYLLFPDGTRLTVQK